jgi:glycosyltransferase involved in cell wall biosynthesis
VEITSQYNLLFYLKGDNNLSSSKDIIIFSTADWNQAEWTNNQHMASTLAKNGFRVLYIESLGLRQPKLGKKDLSRIFKRLSTSFKGLRHVKENVWVYSPLILPLHRYTKVRDFNSFLVVSLVNFFAKILKFKKPIVWTYNPLVNEFISQIDYSILIYHCVDNLSTVPGILAEVVKPAENALVKSADLVFTTSINLQQMLSDLNPTKVHYFGNVADFNHFSKARQPGSIPEDLMAIPQPRIGFVGTIKDYKVNGELISKVAKIKPDWHWVMIGEIVDDIPSKLTHPNIHFLGFKSYHILPDYLRGFDVATLPSLLNEYTTSMFPMKFFEYLSAGKTVVSTYLPSLTSYAECYLQANSPEEFVSAIESVLQGKIPDASHCLALAQEHTWDTRFSKMLKLIEDTCKQKDDVSISKVFTKL